LGVVALSWFVSAVAGHAVVLCTYASSLPWVAMSAGILAVAWFAGFLCLVTPAGLGVMERTLAFLLRFYFPVHVATVVALWTRVARTVVDLVSAAIAWRLQRCNPRSWYSSGMGWDDC